MDWSLFVLVAASLGLGLYATRGLGRSPWRWLIWPQLALVLAASQLAYLGWLPTAILAWPLADKFLHFLLLGAVAFWLELWLGGRRLPLGRRTVPLAVALPLGLATVDELAQGFSTWRSSDLGDWLCDVAGLVLFWWLSRTLKEVPYARA
jgi:VanZ family protein